jgi:hypothetical protein
MKAADIASATTRYGVQMSCTMARYTTAEIQEFPRGMI